MLSAIIILMNSVCAECNPLNETSLGQNECALPLSNFFPCYHIVNILRIVERERECAKTGDRIFNSITGLRSTGWSTDMHKAWIGRPLGRSMLHEEKEPSWVGRPVDRPTFPVSPAMTEGIERSTVPC